MVGRVGGLGGLAEPAQVRADDGVPLGQERRDLVPGRVRARMAVQQQHRRPLAAMAHPEPRLREIDHLERESFEHRPVALGAVAHRSNVLDSPHGS